MALVQPQAIWALSEPQRRERAVRIAWELLGELADPKKLPGVPRCVRNKARGLLRLRSAPEGQIDPDFCPEDVGE